MEPIYIERLTRLANLLDEVAKAKLPFNIESYGGMIWKAKSLSVDLPDQALEEFEACGTFACACGYAGLDPWFQEQGFFLEIYYSDGSTGSQVNVRPQGVAAYNALLLGLSRDEYFSMITEITFGDGTALEAAGDFFGLGKYTTRWLLGWDSYQEKDNPALVADRVREIIDDNPVNT